MRCNTLQRTTIYCNNRVTNEMEALQVWFEARDVLVSGIKVLHTATRTLHTKRHTRCNTQHLYFNMKCQELRCCTLHNTCLNTKHLTCTLQHKAQFVLIRKQNSYEQRLGIETYVRGGAHCNTHAATHSTSVTHCNTQHLTFHKEKGLSWKETGTGWRRLIESPQLQIILHKRATKCRSLLRKMTHKVKGSYESSPPCNRDVCERCRMTWLIYVRHGLFVCEWFTL